MRLRFRSWMSRAIRSRFAKDDEGIAAVEFAMLLPVMFLLFYGTIEFSQALTVDRRVTQIASATADLVARTKETDSTEIDQIMLIADELMKPYDPALLRVTLMNVVSDINDETNTTVCWAYNHNGGANASAVPGANYPLPTGVVEKGDSVVVAEVTYNYNPPLFGFIITNAINMNETFYLKPRLSATIDYGGLKCL